MQLIRKIVFFGLICLFTVGTAGAAETKTGGNIKKCQDASGTWHYGNTAADECAKSKIIEIDKRGLTRNVISAPPSEGDLKTRQQREEERQREEQRLAEEKRRDQVLLGMYGHEDDIMLVRDRKLTQLENSIKATEDTLAALGSALSRFQAQAADEEKSGKGVSEQTALGLERTKAQISDHEAAIAVKRQEQGALREQFAADLERYRELKNPKSTRSEPEANKK